MPQELVRRDEVIVHEDKEELRMMLRVAYERGRLLMHPDELFWRALADGSWAVKAPMLLPPKRSGRSRPSRQGCGRRSSNGRRCRPSS